MVKFPFSIFNEMLMQSVYNLLHDGPLKNSKHQNETGSFCHTLKHLASLKTQRGRRVFYSEFILSRSGKWILDLLWIHQAYITICF